MGNGEEIRAAQDRWIPELAGGRITSYHRGPKDIIQPPKSWNEEKIKNTFLHYESEAIKRIPIAGPDIKDR